MKISTRLGLSVCIASAVFLSGCGRVSVKPKPNTSNKTAHRLHAALGKYADKASVSWPMIHTQKTLKVGDVSPAVPKIRHRLIVLEDMRSTQASESQRFNFQMKYGVEEFQFRHGLKTTGTVGKKTLAALNVSPRARYHEMLASMYKWAELPEDQGSHYIHINVPQFKMFIVRDGQRVMDMKVVAGRPSRKTPNLFSKVKTIVFNPTWTVPKTIVAEDVIPNMRKDPNYMKDHYNMKLYASWKKDAPEIDPLTVDWHSMSGHNFPYRITAPPGNVNPLGRVKFIFENDHDVYMHDTPNKALFSRMQRAYSSGCIRLDKPFHLVEYFFPDNQDLDFMQVHRYLSMNKTKYIALKNPMPIRVTYITSWVDARGKVHFREDIYKHDTSA